jgi:ElaB/YqjD/DUF883 family membrane-anchored ribosome-binding protein
MEQEEQKEESRQEAPGIGDIAAELKELGARIKEVLVSAAQSERARKLQQQALAGFDLLMERTGKVIEDAKTGQLEKDAKKNLHQSLQKVNEKLKEYSDSINKPEPQEETKEAETAKKEPEQKP